MPSILRMFRHRKVTASAEITLIASSNLPDSGSVSVENSKGASAASAELLPYLSSCLEDYDPNGEFD